MRFYTPIPKLEIPPKEQATMLAELRALGFGRKARTPEHAEKYPTLDEFAFLLEQEALEREP